jgi:hypothetical protein
MSNMSGQILNLTPVIEPTSTPNTNLSIETVAPKSEPPSITTLAPIWSGIFERWSQGKLKRSQKQDIVEDLAYINTNPVAEAYGETRFYDRDSPNFCNECSWFAWSYRYIVNYNRGNEDLCLDNEICKLKGEQFVIHWNQHHNGHHENKDVMNS